VRIFSVRLLPLISPFFLSNSALNAVIMGPFVLAMAFPQTQKLAERDGWRVFLHLSGRFVLG
jgi:hypothetical protein